jgi:hypothetical protein
MTNGFIATEQAHREQDAGHRSSSGLQLRRQDAQVVRLLIRSSVAVIMIIAVMPVRPCAVMVADAAVMVADCQPFLGRLP